ncbi:hypothetical protein CLV51_105165 [Chitinophaga niastensis]|uniref:Uncharacterized protein n=1 Tax=Chitinophaga niastensis TaxID=536980 RepID=A0A2P8HF00_CHINA|nr:DUF5908 family protein [Chitinophaga niastensis]PSL44793.1 hypothetical protein CLV51_105165 [Chitinophaga niastensis]
MPVQINEVIIRTVIESPSGSTGGGTHEDVPPAINRETETVEKVLEIIREKNER